MYTRGQFLAVVYSAVLLFSGLVLHSSPLEIQTVRGETGGPSLNESSYENLTGNWTINASDTVYYGNRTINLTGNLTIYGNLTLQNVTLRFNSTYDGQHGIYVERGGSLVIKDNDGDRNTTGDGCNITVVKIQNAFIFQVKNGSTFQMNNSGLHYCGYDFGLHGENAGLWVNSNESVVRGNNITNSINGVILYKVNNCSINWNNISESRGRHGASGNQGQPGEIGSGIYLLEGTHCGVSRNNIYSIVGGGGGQSTGYEIDAGDSGIGAGIFMERSSANNITLNNISTILCSTGSQGGTMARGSSGGTSSGIFLRFSNDNTLNLNIVNSVTGGNGGTAKYGASSGAGGIGTGIYLNSSIRNNMTNNNFSSINGGNGGARPGHGSEGSNNVGYGIYIDDNSKENNISFSNIINGDNILYYYNVGKSTVIENYNVSSNSNPTNYGKIAVIQCSNLIIYNNTIAGFKGGPGKTGSSHIRGNGGDVGAGIYVESSSNISITSNRINSITGGIGGSGGCGALGGLGGISAGVYFTSSSYNNLTSNKINLIRGGMGGKGGGGRRGGTGAIGSGVYLSSSLYNKMISTNISTIIGGAGGVSGWSSSRGVHNVGYGIYFEDNSLENTILPSNIMDGDNIIYYYNVSTPTGIRNYNLSSGSNPTKVGKIALIRCSNFTVDNNTLKVSSNINSNIFLDKCMNITISNNTCNSNKDSINLYNSNNNVIQNNSCSDGICGIEFERSNDNILSNNTCDKNDIGIVISHSANTTITNNTCDKNDIGLLISYSSNNIITNNNYDDNNESAIIMEWSNNNTMSLCNVTNNRVGANIKMSENCTVENSTFYSNTVYGIDIENSVNHTMLNNIMTGCGFHISGRTLIEYNSHIIANNSVNNGPLYYLTNQNGSQIPDGAKQIMIINCTNVTISDQNLSDVDVGTLLAYSSSNIIQNTTYQNNTYGIVLQNTSSYNKILNNTYTNNTYGIHLASSSHSNVIMSNNCSYNTYGLSVSHSNNNTIRCNNYSNNDYGILISYSTAERVENNTCIFNTHHGIYTYYSHNNSIINNTANNNSNYGLFIQRSDRNRITNNSIISNSIRGISLYYSDSNVIINNTCRWNGGSGIYSEHANYNIILNNTFSNQTYGIAGDSSSNNRIEYNIFSSHSYSGIRCYSCHLNTIKNNSISMNNNRAIQFQKCSSNNVLNNNCSNNRYFGLSIRDSNNYNFIHNNNFSGTDEGIKLHKTNYCTITNNTISSNRGTGLILYNCDHGFISNNLINDNGKGIIITHESWDNTISWNSIVGNRGLGINFTSSSCQNSIHHNNFIKNNCLVSQAADNSNNNIWRDGSRTGNFWSDYTARYPSASNNGVRWNLSYHLDGSARSADSNPQVFAWNDNIYPIMLKDNTDMKASTGQLFNFSGNFTDNIQLFEVWANYTHDHKTFFNVSLKQVVNSTWSNSTTISPSAEYIEYFFSALDAGNNWQEFGKTNVSVTDVDKPEMINEYIPESPTTGDIFNIIADFRDNICIDEVRINYTFNEYDYYNISMFNLYDDTWNLSIKIPTWAMYIKYMFYYSDMSGNLNQSIVRNITIHDNDFPILINEFLIGKPTTGDEYHFSAHFSDNINLTNVVIYYTYNSVNYMNKTMTRVNGTLYGTTVIIKSNATYIIYYYKMYDNTPFFNKTPDRRLTVIDDDCPILIKDNSSCKPTTGENFTFAIEAFDNVEIINVTVIYTFDDVNSYNVSMIETNELKWAKEIQIPIDSTYLIYNFHFFDEALNSNSSQVKEINVTDNDAPIFLNDNPPDLFTTGDNYSFLANFSDNIDLMEVYINYSYDDSVYYNRSLDRISKEMWSVDLTIDPSATWFRYYYWIVDYEHNYNMSTIREIQVIDNDPPFLIEDFTSNITYTGDTIQFSISIHDNIGVSIVNVSYLFDGNQVHISSLVPSSYFNWTGSIPISNISTRLEYYYYFEDYSGNNNTSMVKKIKIIDNENPNANAGLDQILEQDSLVIFYGNGSADNIGVVNYTWLFVYNNSDILLYGPNPTFNFFTPGNYTLQLTVRDELGNNATDSMLLTIKENPNIKNDDSDNSDTDSTEGFSDILSKIINFIINPYYIFFVIAIFIVIFILFRRKSKKEITSSEIQVNTEETTEAVMIEDEDDNEKNEMNTKGIDEDKSNGNIESLISCPTCTSCGAPSNYYPEYDCFWCETCQSYVLSETEEQYEFQPPPPPLPEDPIPPSLPVEATSIPPLMSHEAPLAEIDDVEFESKRDAVLEEYNDTKEMLDKAPAFLDVSEPLEILERAKAEIENGEYDKASDSIRESKSTANGIRERYGLLVEKSALILKDVKELKALDNDMTSVIDLLSEGKKALGTGDLSLCREHFNNASSIIEEIREKGSEESGDEGTGIASVPEEISIESDGEDNGKSGISGDGELPVEEMAEEVVEETAAAAQSDVIHVEKTTDERTIESPAEDQNEERPSGESADETVTEPEVEDQNDERSGNDEDAAEPDPETETEEISSGTGDIFDELDTLFD